MSNVVCEVESSCQLGEGPLWIPSGKVLWVDIEQHHLHELDLKTGQHQSKKMPIQLTAIAQREQGGFIGTAKDQFVILDENYDVVEYLGLVEPEHPNNRFNDGKVDAAGRFWAGTMDNLQNDASGSLYCLEKGTWTKQDSDIVITNGPTFSADGKTLYHTDTLERKIYAFDMAEDGNISNKRLFIEIPEEEGFPDGMTVDANGNIWVCHFFGWRITRFDPTGNKIDHIPMPVSCITSCTFGGENLDTLYITTAAVALDEEQLKKEPLAGGMFSLKVDAKGLPTNTYAG